MMADSLINRLFRRKPEQHDKPHKPNTEEAAHGEVSNLYTAKDFTKYNPDSLIGRKGAPIYRAMMRDEQVKAAVRFKRDAITSRRVNFLMECGDVDSISDAEKDERIALFQFIIDNVAGTWIDSINGIMSAMYNGFSLTEKIHKQIEFRGKTYWGLHCMKLRPFDTFTFKVDKFGNKNEITQRVGSLEIPLKPENFIHYVVNPDIDEHYGGSELREAYRAWYSKDMIIKFRNIWLERHAGGFRWTELKQGASLANNSPEHAALQEVLSNINILSSAIMPTGIEMKSDYPAHTAGFKEAIDDNDKAIARALLVPPLLGVSPQGNTGSYSQGDVQLEAFFWTLQSENIRLEECLNTQIFHPLGMLNWGDGVYPCYRHKPLSDRQIREVLKTWKELADAGIVEHSELDEDHIRDLLDMPDRVADENALKRSDPTSAFNGTQVQSLVGVLDSVRTAKMDPATAEQVLISAFPISEIKAKEMIATIKVEPEADPITPPGGDAEGNPPPGGEQEGDASGNPAPGQQRPEETVRGMGLVSVGAFKKAKQRVDYAVIEQKTESMIALGAMDLSKVGADLIADLVAKAKKSDDVAAGVKNLKPASPIKTAIKKTVSKYIREAAAVGRRSAQNEIDKAKGSAFSMSYDFERFNFISEEYFESKAFWVTGSLVEDFVELMGEIILAGARANRDWREVEADIYQSFSDKGLVSVSDVPDLLKQGLNEPKEGVPARLRTIMRTNTFDAVNTARYNYYTDPQLDGFVKAFEYSAILDSRTTDVCRHLDEDNAGNHSVEWYKDNAGFIPPNHFNCRSLLIPVTVIDIDEFEEGGEPTEFPQEGFGQ